MLNLNAGVELDNELIDPEQEAGKELDKALFKDVTPGEIPELNPMVDVDALVTKQRALGYVQNNLETIGGINQQFVLESMSLVPGLVTDQCPLGFYSQDITKTRYSFALEAIQNEQESVLKRIIDAVKAFFAAIKERIAKIVELIKKKYDEYRKSKMYLGTGIMRVDNLFRNNREATMLQLTKLVNSEYGQEIGEQFKARFTAEIETMGQRYESSLENLLKTPYFSATLSPNSVIYEIKDYMPAVNGFMDKLSDLLIKLSADISVTSMFGSAGMDRDVKSILAHLDTFESLFKGGAKEFISRLDQERGEVIDVKEVTQQRLQQVLSDPIRKDFNADTFKLSSLNESIAFLDNIQKRLGRNQTNEDVSALQKVANQLRDVHRQITTIVMGYCGARMAIINFEDYCRKMADALEKSMIKFLMTKDPEEEKTAVIKKFFWNV